MASAHSTDALPAVEVLPLGAILKAFRVGSHNLVLSFPRLDDYIEHNAPYFGETIGRVANRISGAKINNVNGRSYPLAANDGGNHCLHGGRSGWGKKAFTGPTLVERGGKQASLFTHTSPAGDEGFPAAVECRVWYSWTSDIDSRGREKTTLDVEYEVVHAAANGEAADDTVVAVTNHSYFNLGPDPATIAGTTLDLATNLHLEVDESLIPTGRIKPYPGVSANVPIVLHSKEPFFDHCFVVSDGLEPNTIPLDTRSREFKRLVTLYHPDTKLKMTVESTEPSFQLYTGDGINVPAVSGAAARGSRSGIAIEPQRYVNAANEPSWQKMVLLSQGDIWGSKSRYIAWKE